VSEIPPLPPVAPPAPAPGLPWEEPNAGLGSIVPTAVQILRSPFQAFAKMSLTVDLVRPIAYFVAFVLLGTLIGQIWSYLFFDFYIGLFRSVLGSRLDSVAPLLHRPGAGEVIFGLIITPLIWVVALFVWTALVHIGLLLLGGAKHGFAATLRVICYAETAQLAVVVPFLGGLIAVFWQIVLQMIGLAEAHRTDGWKAAVAVIAPLVLCCFCIITGAVMFGTALMQVLQQAK